MTDPSHDDPAESRDDASAVAESSDVRSDGHVCVCACRSEVPGFEGYLDGEGGPSPFEDTSEVDALAAAQLRTDAIADYEDQMDSESWAFYESEFLTDDDVVLGLPAQVSTGDLHVLDSIDPAGLSSPLAVLAYIARVDAVSAMLAGKRLAAVVELAGVVPKLVYLENVHLEEELACARRTSTTSAALEIERARALRQMFTGFQTALLAGEISASHVSILVEKCRIVDDPEILSRIEALVLPKAKRLPPGEFGRQVSRAITKLDPDAAGRRVKARKSRGVWFRAEDDGMASLTVYGPVEWVKPAFDRITEDGRALQLARGGASAARNDEDARADACRADAALARLTGETHADGSVTFDPSHANITIDVVMTEASFASFAAGSGGANGAARVGGTASAHDAARAIDAARANSANGVDELALVNGEPVPASVAREYVRFAKAWRRAVVAPVTGHLIDHGRKVYLPNDLREYLIARDGGCIGPMCSTRHRSKIQMEHGQPFPYGPSDTTNCRIWCTTDHHLKTDGYLDITNLAPDGSATWLTKFGQRIDIPPRPFLDTPDPPEPPGTGPDATPPATPGDDTRPETDTSPPARPEPPQLDEPPF